MEFFSRFFKLAGKHSKPSTRIALLCADWRAFKGISALSEDPTLAITILNYSTSLEKTGWIVTHIIDCPLSTQRFNAVMVGRMQKNRTLGVVRRTLLVAKR